MKTFLRLLPIAPLVALPLLQGCNEDCYHGFEQCDAKRWIHLELSPDPLQVSVGGSASLLVVVEQKEARSNITVELNNSVPALTFEPSMVIFDALGGEATMNVSVSSSAAGQETVVTFIAGNQGNLIHDIDTLDVEILP